MTESFKIDKYRELLAIDRNDLDDALLKQAELYDNVAEAHVQTIAVRDSLKLDLEECQAQEDGKIREQAVIDQEKVTESAIQNRLRLVPRYSKLQHQLIEAQTEVGEWAALKEAFIQRGYAIKGLVDLYVVRMKSSDSVTTAVGITKNAVADDNRIKTGQERTRRRLATG